MYYIIKSKLKDLQKIKKIIKEASSPKNNFYSDYNGLLLSDLLKKNVYTLVNDKKKCIGIIIINKRDECLLYFPNNDIELNVLISNLVKHNNFSEYFLKINYRNINPSIILNDMPVKLIKDFKCMSALTVKRPPIDTNQNIRLIKMILQKDEAERVKIQNEIFGNVVGRRELTLNEVYNEEEDNGFVKDLCFFLSNENEKIGYGQIIDMNEKYYLVNYGILPQYRNKGYGYEFLKEVINKCNEYGISKLFLTVDNSNISAIKLYEKLHFKEEYNICTVLL